MRVVEANDLFISSKRPNDLPAYQRSNLIDRGYSSTGWAWDADFFDFDNDGDEDLYVLNGMNEFNLYSSDNPYYTDPLQDENIEVQIAQANADRNVLFVNESGRLQDRSKGSGLDIVSNSRSAAYLDFDGDGLPDIAVNNYHGPVMLFRNQSPSKNNWIRIKLEGKPTAGISIDAIGARVLIKGRDNKSLWRELHATVGYQSGHPKEILAGTGSDETLTATVRWPDGSQSVFNNLKSGQLHTLRWDPKQISNN